MSTPFSFNALLSLPEDFSVELELGSSYTIKKEGSRITPFLMPMEICTHDHIYLGKVKVTEIKITKGGTDITFEVVKLFSEEESQVFSTNFIKP